MVQVFFIRGGRLIGTGSFLSADLKRRESLQKSWTALSMQYYAGTPFIPAELMLQEEVEDRELLEEWLSIEARPEGICSESRRREQRRNWWSWHGENAQAGSLQRQGATEKRGRAYDRRSKGDCRKLLGLEEIVRMEAYDISNTNGFESVGSMVVYERGRPKTE